MQMEDALTQLSYYTQIKVYKSVDVKCKCVWNNTYIDAADFVTVSIFFFSNTHLCIPVIYQLNVFPHSTQYVQYNTPHNQVCVKAKQATPNAAEEDRSLNKQRSTNIWEQVWSVWLHKL